MSKMRNQKIDTFFRRKPVTDEKLPSSSNNTLKETNLLNRRDNDYINHNNISKCKVRDGKRPTTKDSRCASKNKKMKVSHEFDSSSCKEVPVIVIDDDSDVDMQMKKDDSDNNCMVVNVCSSSPAVGADINHSISPNSCDNSVKDEGTVYLHNQDFDPDLFTPVCEIIEDELSEQTCKLSSKDKTDVQEAERLHDEKDAVPYYLKNFRHIMQCVLKNSEELRLFNDDDQKHIGSFCSLSDSAQRLYVRMFQRKHKWLRPHKLEYREIPGDIASILNELTSVELVEKVSELSELETALKLLSLQELKTLSKEFNINISGKGKSDMVQILIKHGKEHKTLFGTVSAQSVTMTILKRAKVHLGCCYRLIAAPRRVFVRIMMLFSLPSTVVDEDEGSGGHQSILTMLLVDMGKLTFPEYEVHREAIPFPERDDLIRFEEAIQLEMEMMTCIESKDFDHACTFYSNAMKLFCELERSQIPDRDSQLPSFLRCFTAGHVYTRCLSRGVDVLQRLKKYDEAVQLLEKLLSHKVYYQDSRGRWWDRLALNMQYHLKQPEKAARAIQDGLKDVLVKTGHRLALQQRATRLFNSNSMKGKKNFSSNIEMSSIKDPPKILIRGQLYLHCVPGRKSVFISNSLEGSDDVEVLSVEELALQYYKQQGFIEGIHGESMPYHSIFGIFFWDIIYAGDLPDAFRSSYQTVPLDLNSDDFFRRREGCILDRLNKLRKLTCEELAEIVSGIWMMHHGKSSLVSWDKFVNVVQVQNLVKCLGSKAVAGICDRLARDFRHCRSGLPDLLVWNSVKGVLKAAEVKGPGDRLSTKQQLWLDYLMSIGIDVEVCHVEGLDTTD